MFLKKIDYDFSDSLASLGVANRLVQNLKEVGERNTCASLYLFILSDLLVHDRLSALKFSDHEIKQSHLLTAHCIKVVRLPQTYKGAAACHFLFL